jgi:hypothetical protein
MHDLRTYSYHMLRGARTTQHEYNMNRLTDLLISSSILKKSESFIFI